MRCGIEFEYMMVDIDGPEAGRLRDFSNLPYPFIRRFLDDKPGRDDPELATGDLGIKSGYWYLEGDERFDDEGRFRTLAVKGVEIRTPPAATVDEAIGKLLGIERHLAETLAGHGLGLAIAGFNPIRPAYAFEPPLNAWEKKLRQRFPAYAGSLVSTLSYGPDINLSMPGWSMAQCLAASRKLNWYAPYIVPFSFNSPFFAGKRWPGCSKRTFERAGLRPAVKLFMTGADYSAFSPTSSLVHPARLASEAGRIEFKAFDALPSPELLAACCHLLVGICLSEDLPGHGERADVDLYRHAAQVGFADEQLCRMAGEILGKAQNALRRAGDAAASGALAPLASLLCARRTPAHELVAAYRHSGLMFKPGGLACPLSPG